MTQTFMATDFMGIDGEAVIELSSGGQMVVLAGQNGAGKSSFRIGMEHLFISKSDKLIPAPVHKGKTESRVEFIDTELDVRLTCVWRLQPDGTTRVTYGAYALDGAKYESPRAFAAKLLGASIIDPSEFVAFDQNKQRDVLLSKVELPFDPAVLAAQRKGYFDGRTDTTREVKRLAIELAAFPAPDPAVPAEEVKSATLRAELEARRAHNLTVDAAEDAAEFALSEVARLTAEGDAAKKHLEQLRTEFLAAGIARDAAVAAADLAQRKDLAEVEAEIDSADDTNAKVRAQAARAKVAAEHAARLADEAALNEKIAAIDQQKVDGLAAAVFPSEGLSIDEDGVTVNGLPFVSLNEGEQLLVAFDIAISVDQPLKLVFVKHGDALDDDTLAKMQARGEAKGWTVMVDRGRDNSADFGFVFDAGVLAVAA